MTPTNTVTRDPGIRAVLSISTGEMNLTQTATLTLTIEGPAPLRIDLPDPLFDARTIGQFQIQPQPSKVSELGENRQQWSQTFQIDPFSTDNLQIMVQPIKLRVGMVVEPVTIRFDPLKVHVSSNIGNPDISLLHKDASIETLPPLPESSSFPWWIVAVGLLIVFAWRRGKRKPAAIPPTPAQLALSQLERTELLAEIADVLRRYFEAIWDLPASKRTTPEVLREVSRMQKLSSESAEKLADILEACDRAKFAGELVDRETIVTILSRARQLIGECAVTDLSGKIG